MENELADGLVIYLIVPKPTFYTVNPKLFT